MKERKFRSFAKAISWRIIAFCITTFIVFFFTHKEVVAISVGILDSLVKIFAYYFHERAWEIIPIGKVKHPLEYLNLNKRITSEDKIIIEDKLRDLGYID